MEHVRHDVCPLRERSGHVALVSTFSSDRYSCDEDFINLANSICPGKTSGKTADGEPCIIDGLAEHGRSLRVANSDRFVKMWRGCADKVVGSRMRRRNHHGVLVHGYTVTLAGMCPECEEKKQAALAEGNESWTPPAEGRVLRVPSAGEWAIVTPVIKARYWDLLDASFDGLQLTKPELEFYFLDLAVEWPRTIDNAVPKVDDGLVDENGVQVPASIFLHAKVKAWVIWDMILMTIPGELVHIRVDDQPIVLVRFPEGRIPRRDFDHNQRLQNSASTLLGG